jgi:hypothetical protein
METDTDAIKKLPDSLYCTMLQSVPAPNAINACFVLPMTQRTYGISFDLNTRVAF